MSYITENMHCNFCDYGMYKFHDETKDIKFRDESILHWLYKCDKCEAEIYKNVNPEEIVKNNFTIIKGDVTYEN